MILIVGWLWFFVILTAILVVALFPASLLIGMCSYCGKNMSSSGSSLPESKWGFPKIGDPNIVP